MQELPQYEIIHYLTTPDYEDGSQNPLPPDDSSWVVVLRFCVHIRSFSADRDDYTVEYGDTDGFTNDP
jgi:hypothetical protein